MRWLLRIGAGIVPFLLTLIVAVMLASESGEVVVLTTADGATTRLWVVDHDGSAWLRSGAPGRPGFNGSTAMLPWKSSATANSSLPTLHLRSHTGTSSTG